MFGLSRGIPIRIWIVTILWTLVTLIMTIFAIGASNYQFTSPFILLEFSLSMFWFGMIDHYSNNIVMLRNILSSPIIFIQYLFNFIMMGLIVGKLIVSYYIQIFSGLITFLGILSIQLPSLIANEHDLKGTMEKALRISSPSILGIGALLLFLGLVMNSMVPFAIMILFVILALDLLFPFMAKLNEGEKKD